MTPNPCAWCQKEQEISPQPGESHGICQNHMRGELQASLLSISLVAAIGNHKFEGRLSLDGSTHCGALQDLVGLMLLYPWRDDQDASTLGELVSLLRSNGHEVELHGA